MKIAAAPLLCAALAGCANLALPQSAPRCVAFGLTVTLTDGKLGKSGGCVEVAPYPGEPMPPKS